MLEHFQHRLETLIGGQPLGCCLVAALAATCLSSLWTSHGLAFSAHTRAAVQATLGSATLTLALGVACVQRDRTELVTLILDGPQGDPSRHARLIAETLSRLFHALVLTPAVLTPVMALLACALARKHTLTAARTAAIGAALLACLTLAQVWYTFASYPHGYHCDRACQYEALATSIQTLRTSKLALAAIACLVWVVALARLRREALHAAPPLLARASTALLALGLAACVATRAMRWDAQHLMPRDAPNVGPCYPSPLPLAQLPPAPPDCIALQAPLLDLSLGTAIVDGTPLTRPAEVTEAFRNKAELWTQLNPGQPFPGAFIILAPSQAKPTELAPWLSAVQRAGYSRPAAYVRAPTLVDLN